MRYHYLDLIWRHTNVSNYGVILKSSSYKEIKSFRMYKVNRKIFSTIKYKANSKIERIFDLKSYNNSLRSIRDSAKHMDRYDTVYSSSFACYEEDERPFINKTKEFFRMCINNPL